MPAAFVPSLRKARWGWGLQGAEEIPPRGGADGTTRVKGQIAASRSKPMERPIDGSSCEPVGKQLSVRKRRQGTQRGNLPRQRKGTQLDSTVQEADGESGRLAVLMWAH
eukprot:15670019-Heterocapsa_arctica.AAC.1